MMKKTKISFNAPVILSFVIVCFIVTIISVLNPNNDIEFLFSISHSSLSDPLTYLRMFTHVFGHAGMDHFINNALFLLLLGPMLEEKYDSTTMAKIIITTAFVTGVFHYLLYPNSLLCGASGIAFALIILSSFTVFKSGEIPLSAILVVIFFIGNEISNGIIINDDISNLTHILGGVVGGVAGYVLNKKD